MAAGLLLALRTAAPAPAAPPYAGTASPHAAAAPVARAGAGSGAGIRHVVVIVLENRSYRAAYVTNPHPYLGRVLQRRGTLLTHYFAIGHLSATNYVAMVSGQAPNQQTQTDCSRYVDFRPAPGRLDGAGQARGSGCVFPRNVRTLPDQLTAAHISWRGYFEDLGKQRGREANRCGRPGSSAGNGSADGTRVATARDQYTARHNPFIYFHSLIDSGQCRARVLPLGHLQGDLRRRASTPRLAFVVPDLCSDGHDSPCADGRPGGLASVDAFLRTWVPRIVRAPAFRHHGLLVITSDESDGSDTAACCRERPGPNASRPGFFPSGTGRGGGRVGTLLLGPCVRHGVRDDTPYNHYALLRTLEDLFGIRTGGTDGRGHLGFAAAPKLRPVGGDAFTGCT